MAFTKLFPIPALERLFDSLLPDLILAFTFFTALTHLALGRQFGRNRAAAAMSVAVGMALSVGLVWWEDRRGYSIRDLGWPALVLAMIAVCVAVFQSARRLGGKGAGSGLALAVLILLLWVLGAGAGSQALAMLFALGVVAALLSMLLHAHTHARAVAGSPIPPAPSSKSMAETVEVQEDLRELHRDRGVAKGIWDRLRRLRRDTSTLRQHPEDASSALERLKRMLPAEGWLTERLARLRSRAHRVREGHVARIKELRELTRGLPAETKRRASQELTARYHELRLDTRLERLDKAVAENERRIRDLTVEAERATEAYDFRKLTELLAEAERLQGHNSTLLRKIECMEQKLVALAREVGEVIQKWRREAGNPVRVEVRRRGQSTADAAETDARSAGLYCSVGDILRKRFHGLRASAAQLPAGGAEPSMIMTQLERSMPEEGWLTEQLAHLRARMHRLRKQHEAGLAEAQRLAHDLDGSARRRIRRSARRRSQLARMEKRLERLDGAVAAVEKRVRETTRDAIQALSRGDAARLTHLLRSAEDMQNHANKLLKIIERTERKLAEMTAEFEKHSKRGEAP